VLLRAASPTRPLNGRSEIQVVPLSVAAARHWRHAGQPCGRRLREARRVQRLVFSRSRYPHIGRHFRGALRRGWPRRLVLNRPGADARRDRALEDIPTRDGFDRDEYPPAVGRGKGPGLERGRHPRGWKADVLYVPSSENRSHGAVLGNKLEPFYDGTRFRYVFR